MREFCGGRCSARNPTYWPRRKAAVGLRAEQRARLESQHAGRANPTYSAIRSNRHRHRLEGGIAVDQVDPLLDDAEARAVAPQPVVLAAGEDALLVVAVLDHDH